MAKPLKLGFTMENGSDKFAPRPQHGVSKSARVAEGERTINRLEEENSRLLQELNDVRSLYTQLTTESTRESFDERRVNLLKSQVIQLERQNSLLIETLNGNSETLLETENALTATIDYHRSVLARKSTSEVRVSCAELDQIVTTLESTRKRLCRMAEKTSSLRDYSKPLLWYGSFLRSCSDQPVTLFDVCQGDIEHINLKHVGRLESKLVNLHKELVLVNNTLQICNQSSSADEGISVAPTAVYSRLSNQVQYSCDLLKDVCGHLLQLSLLVPAAPLPALNKPPSEPLTFEDVMAVLDKSLKSAKIRDAKVKRLIEALIKYVKVSVNHAGIENQLLLEELEFYQAIYKLETQYIESLFSSVNKCYAKFESNMQEVICQPLREVLEVFDEFRESANNDSLLHFIDTFRSHASRLSETVQKLSVNDKVCQFFESEYGTQFQKRMKKCYTECRKKRDLCMTELFAVKQQLSEQTNELVQIMNEKDQHVNDKTVQVRRNMQTHYMSQQKQTVMLNERKPRQSEAECACQPENTNTTVTFPDGLKTSAVAVPSSIADACCLPAFLITSVPTMMDQSPPSKQVRPKRLVPGIVQQRVVLKPNQDSFNCNEISHTFTQAAKSTDTHGRNIPVATSTSCSREFDSLSSLMLR